jgi:competence protein ComGC
MEVVAEFFMFLKARKRFWLWPLFILLFLLSLLLVLAQGSALAPFIYSLF